MALLNITREDRVKGMTYPVDWYPCLVKEHKAKVSKAGDSTNHTYNLEILEGKFKGGIIYCQFNTKAMGMIVPFLEGLGFDIPEDEDLQFDPEAPVGRKCLVYNGNRMYNDRPQNDPKEFRPLT